MYTERWHLRLKSEILHRNANARADLVADLLINAVKEMEIALDVRDERKLHASYRIKENNIRHRMAIRFYKNSVQKIVRTGD
ncbi:hypothetical protein Q1695_011824 [Nippostrongylus brasiliensis]|nr:hypothetical protein Q1695_011824 [Nippostrongylus brasiliensis]